MTDDGRGAAGSVTAVEGPFASVEALDMTLAGSAGILEPLGEPVAMHTDDTEMLDAELFREIEDLLDSGRADIQEAFFAAIDSDELMQTAVDDGEMDRGSIELSARSVHSDGADRDAELHTRERELLEREVKFLEAQREFLQFKTDAASSTLRLLDQADHGGVQSWEMRLEDERRRLEEVRRQQKMLSELMAQQQKSACGLEVLLMQAPVNHYRMALMTPMESHIRLGKDPLERRATLMGLRDSKIAAVRHFVEYQSQHIDPRREFFYLDTFEKFGKFYTVDLSVSFLARASIAEVADIIQDQFVIPLDGVSQMLGCVSNREYFDGVEETFLHARIVDRVDVPQRKLGDRGFVVQESNAVFYRKCFPEDGDFTVLASDCIDDDELHPYRSKSRIRKDICVGITLRRHRDAATGVDGVVMKRFSFIRHHLQHREPTPELVHAISTRVILWGQAIRFFIAGRHHRPEGKRVWSKYRFPRLPAAVEDSPLTAPTE